MNEAMSKNLSLALQFSIILLQHAAELNQAILAAQTSGTDISPEQLAGFRARAMGAVDTLAAAAQADTDIRLGGG